MHTPWCRVWAAGQGRGGQDMHTPWCRGWAAGQGRGGWGWVGQYCTSGTQHSPHTVIDNPPG